MASRKESKRGGGDTWAPIFPVPEDAPSPEALIVRLTPKDHVFAAAYDYRDEAGRLLFGVVRYNSTKDPEPGKKRDKEFKPFTFCDGPNGAREWRAAAPPKPWPLYGLDQLAARPDAPVLLCEGEKKANAAREMFPDFVAVSSMSGSKSAANADWSPAAGRDVTIWPDNDEAGAEYAREAAAALYEAGAASVRLVKLPEVMPGGFDVADDLPEGVTAADLRSWLEAAEIVEAETDGDDDLDAEIERLAGLSVVQYERERKAAADRLGVRASVLDRLVNDARPAVVSDDDSAPGQPVGFSEPELWPEPVAGELLLGELADGVRRYVVMSDDAALGCALWVLHTYLVDIAQFSPRLAITSPEKRCGKSTVLEVMSKLAHRPLPAANISAAAVYRTIEAARPTLLIDEADTHLGDDDALRGILNSGHSRSASKVIRCVPVGDDFQPRWFETFGPVAIAAIGKIPDTLADRALPIELRRATQSERRERLRMDKTPHLDRLRRMAARWAKDNRAALRGADPDVPEALYNRAADNWRPLLAIADLAGGEWPERARQAAVILSRDAAADDQSSKVMLLSDLRDLFVETRAMRLETGTILERLHDMPTRPWCEWQHGKPMTARQLAQALAPFKVAPVQWKDGYGRGRGYTFADLREAFDRYLSSDGQQSGGRLVPDSGCPVPDSGCSVPDAVPDLVPAKTKQKQRGPGCPAFSGGG